MTPKPLEVVRWNFVSVNKVSLGTVSGQNHTLTSNKCNLLQMSTPSVSWFPKTLRKNFKSPLSTTKTLRNYFSSKNCFHYFHFCFNETSNFRNRILANQKQELVIKNCQWNSMLLFFKNSNYFIGVRTIAPEENWSLVRIKVWVTVKVRDNFGV